MWRPWRATRLVTRCHTASSRRCAQIGHTSGVDGPSTADEFILVVLKLDAVFYNVARGVASICTERCIVQDEDENTCTHFRRLLREPIPENLLGLLIACAVTSGHAAI